jgi:hypothetical protein
MQLLEAVATIDPIWNRLFIDRGRKKAKRQAGRLCLFVFRGKGKEGFEGAFTFRIRARQLWALPVRQARRARLSTVMREVALRYRMSIFVLPYQDYAIRKGRRGDVGAKIDQGRRWQEARGKRQAARGVPLQRSKGCAGRLMTQNLVP